MMILLKFIFFFASLIFVGIHNSCSCTHSSSQLDTTIEKLHNVVILCRLDNVSATGRRSTETFLLPDLHQSNIFLFIRSFQL
jgi:hypothetical protein